MNVNYAITPPSPHPFSPAENGIQCAACFLMKNAPCHLKTISPDSFAMICFLVLMENGNGLSGKSPDYITEKMSMLRAGVNAFGYLDICNMRKAMKWCEEWKIAPPPEVAEEFRLQEGAEELGFL